MARYWLNDGQPLTDGRYCFVIDPEDGTQPTRSYGKSQQECLEKVAKVTEHSQRLISRLQAQLNTASATPTAAPAIAEAPKPRKLSPDEQMTATADLGNPAKAGEAVVKLIEHHTGVDLRAQAQRESAARLAKVSDTWSNTYQPDFSKQSTFTDKTFLINRAIQDAGGADNVTVESLEKTYTSLLAQGHFAGITADYEEGPGEPSIHDEPPQVPPRESAAPRTPVRTPSGATTYKSSNLRGHTPPAPKPTVEKYTRAQVDAMSSAEMMDKMQSEPGFSELVRKYADTRRAS